MTGDRRVLLLPVPPLAGDLASAIRAHEPSIELVEARAGSDEDTLEAIEVALGWAVSPERVARMPRLRWLASIAAGVEKLLVPGLPAHVVVSRIVDPEQAEGIAQYVAAQVLAHARGLARYAAQQAARDWTRQPMARARHRVLVLGTGATGAAIVDWLRRVGLDARGWNRSSTLPLRPALAEADVVVCALPLTAATEGILDAAAFAAMPKGGFVVNVARGGHVVEADLIAAVRSGRLAGAALDVQRTEPLPADDPLWDVPGIVVTPHIAAQSSVATIAAQFAAAWRAWQRGEPVPNAIDRARGY